MLVRRNLFNADSFLNPIELSNQEPIIFDDFEFLEEVSSEPVQDHDETEENNLVEPILEDTTTSAETRKRRYTPPEKVTRKRQANPEKWVKNVAQQKLAKGEEHISVKGTLRRGRQMQKGCDKSCRFKCQEKINENNRLEIFTQFWKIPSQKEKWDFIAIHLEIKSVENTTKISKRQSSRKYFFRVNGTKVRVCKVMFLDTLDVCDSLVETTVSKLKFGGYISPDKRKGRCQKSPRTETAKETVREHIALIPRMPSHYSREASSREYLTEEFQSCADMHAEYVNWMSSNYPEKPVASLRQYRDVFNLEFNISFFLSKKDVCDECTTWNNTPEEQRQAIQDKYRQHLDNKDLVNAMKESDTKLARNKETGKTLVVAHFDYEKNLICPKANTSVFYYKRKLCVSNFTIVDVGRFEDNCYVYDESIANKGSNEVASFLLDFIQRKVESGMREFRFYSDNCGGQNKNRNVAALYAYAAGKYNIVISHRFLEKGHTYNAADSVHSVIERKARPLNIYSPDEWYDIISNAKRSKAHPIKIIKVNQDMVFNWTELSTKLQLNKDSEGRAIPWRSVRQFETNCSNAHKIKFKTNFSEESKVICTKGIGRPVNFCNYELRKAYTGPLRISKLKYDDLMFYCNRKHIPEKHHPFYTGLKYGEVVRDEDEIGEQGRARKRRKAVPRNSRKKVAATAENGLDDDEDFVF